MMASHLNYRGPGNKLSENGGAVDLFPEGDRLDGPLEIESSNTTTLQNHDEPDRSLLPPVAITSVPWACEADSNSNSEVNTLSRTESNNAKYRSEKAQTEKNDKNGEDDIANDDTRGLLANVVPIDGKAAAVLGVKDRKEETVTQASNLFYQERQTTSLTLCKCIPCEKIGNCTIILPNLYRRSNGWLGIVGPHWYGSLCTLGLLWGAGGHFTYKAFCQAFYYISTLKLQRAGSSNISDISDITLGWKEMGIAWLKPTLCCLFLICGTVYLGLTCCANPGIVTEANCGYAEYQETLTQESSDRLENGDAADSVRRRRRVAQFRWCDICHVHQPSHALHCPDCNVCIANYDHHCPWMGTCIGGSNMKPFIRFNLSWFCFLLFVLAFVAFADPPSVKSTTSKLSVPLTRPNSSLETKALSAPFGHDSNEKDTSKFDENP